MTIRDAFTAAAHTPPLPDAACIDHTALFDRTGIRDGNVQAMLRARREALTICNQQCPVRDACRAWVDSLPRSQQPVGVIGGRVIPARISHA